MQDFEGPASFVLLLNLSVAECVEHDAHVEGKLFVVEHLLHLVSILSYCSMYQVVL